ncbi:MAG: hypothetical protein B7Y42_00610 [Polaromonas sp. 28-63-22]|jgi:hypothetical protein|nr:MAG: hypothetical protein B7Y42_00610 [Polaromonas sp. 28-63-22]
MTAFSVLWLVTRLAFWLVVIGFMLFVFFAAVMSLRDARNRGQLTAALKLFGYPTLAIGYTLDFMAQMTLAVAIFAELPPRRWFTPTWSFKVLGRTFDFGWLRLPAVESTVSERTKRLQLTGTGWRQARAIWWRTNVLGPLDTSGGHS